MSEDMNIFLRQEEERPVRKPAAEGSMFLSALSWQDLQRLRAAVKRVYLRHYPSDFCTDEEADKMIEALAPSVAERLIAAQVDNRLEGPDGKVAWARLRLDE